tara:strand:+ start:1152 stop:1478 length:327 start_codon:yes stop_codon:yes gene_type:complete
MSAPKVRSLKPLNRHLLVIPHFKEEKTPSGVILPDDYDPERVRYIEATVIRISPDCSDSIRKIKYNLSDESRIVIDSSMLQEIMVSGKKHYMILENYVLGHYTRPISS